ncbi:phosphoserine transaminase [Candidatus Poriferisodalis sp.]|uniref:phosphoserine transaminase n=1 Tax=Candidatus Poriferisodalis sp. TaxID=3101277 RepID=UPI003B5CC396
MAVSPSSISIPAELRPADGRFGSGPSKVRPEAVKALAARALDYMGTSHRRSGVRSVVGRLRAAMAELFGLSDGWEVVLGNGGSTGFWDAAAFSLIERRAQHLTFGEFSEKFSAVTAAAPHLEDPVVLTAPYGSHPVPEPADHTEIDMYALTHNETSTGVAMPLSQPQLGPTRQGDAPALVMVDATSAAGAMTWDPADVDCYYFAPQKAFAADGGLWIALCSPAAIERIERIDVSGRYKPATLDLAIAVRNSRQDQTYNTPALATVLLTLETAEWMLNGGGLTWAASRSAASSGAVYGWAAERDFAAPFVTDAEIRSPVVCTVDFDGVNADDIAAALRANGIVDTEGYRKLGRNQLRIAAFPAIEPADAEALTACIDYVVEQL